MLRVFKTKSELNEVMDLISTNLPQLIDLYIALKIFLDDLTPDASIEVYAHPWPNVKIFIYIVRNKYYQSYISFRLNENGTLRDVDEILAAAPQLLDVFNEFLSFNTDMNIRVHLEATLSNKFSFSAYSTFYPFYIPIDKQKEIAKMNITLPEGFSFYQIDSEKDTEFINGRMTYASATEIPHTKSKIAHLPSVGVKFDGNLVAFEILYPTGALNHLYVSPEFRGKGLGTAVELKLCQKLIQMDIWPYKFVEKENLPAITMTNKSDLWQNVMQNDSDNPLTFGFQFVSRK